MTISLICDSTNLSRRVSAIFIVSSSKRYAISTACYMAEYVVFLRVRVIIFLYIWWGSTKAVIIFWIICLAPTSISPETTSVNSCSSSWLLSLLLLRLMIACCKGIFTVATTALALSLDWLLLLSLLSLSLSLLLYASISFSCLYLCS